MKSEASLIGELGGVPTGVDADKLPSCRASLLPACSMGRTGGSGVSVGKVEGIMMSNSCSEIAESTIAAATALTLLEFHGIERRELLRTVDSDRVSDGIF